MILEDAFALMAPPLVMPSEGFVLEPARVDRNLLEATTRNPFVSIAPPPPFSDSEWEKLLAVTSSGEPLAMLSVTVCQTAPPPRIPRVFKRAHAVISV